MEQFLIALLFGLAIFMVEEINRYRFNKFTLAFQADLKPYIGGEKPVKPKPKPKGTKHDFAIVKWSGIGQVAGSGKLQGTVLLSNNVIRVWHKTKKVRNSATNLVTGLLSGISTAFRSLTPSQISGWNSSAVDALRKNALAEVKSLTGSQFYQRVNNILLSLNIAGTDNAPGIGSVTALLHIDATGDVSAQTLTSTLDGLLGALTALPTNIYARVYCTKQFNPSKSRFSKSDYRLVAVFPPATSTAPLDYSTEYLAVFGAIALGQRIGVAIELVERDAVGNTFALGGRIYTDCITVA